MAEDRYSDMKRDETSCAPPCDRAVPFARRNIKDDLEDIGSKEWDAIRAPPGTGEATRPGRRASKSSSSARPIGEAPRAEPRMVACTSIGEIG
jgi:hypothetical protein